MLASARSSDELDLECSWRSASRSAASICSRAWKREEGTRRVHLVREAYSHGEPGTGGVDERVLLGRRELEPQAHGRRRVALPGRGARRIARRRARAHPGVGRDGSARGRWGRRSSRSARRASPWGPAPARRFRRTPSSGAALPGARRHRGVLHVKVAALAEHAAHRCRHLPVRRLLHPSRRGCGRARARAPVQRRWWWWGGGCQECFSPTTVRAGRGGVVGGNEAGGWGRGARRGGREGAGACSGVSGSSGNSSVHCRERAGRVSGQCSGGPARGFGRAVLGAARRGAARVSGSRGLPGAQTRCSPCAPPPAAAPQRPSATPTGRNSSAQAPPRPLC